MKTTRMIAGLLVLVLVMTLAPLGVFADVADASHRACAHTSSYRLDPDSYVEETDTTGGYRRYVCEECGASYDYSTDPLVYEVNPKTGGPITLDYAANPYLPNYDFMPDNELHVFWSREDSEWRVYAVGSHDKSLSGWCGDDINCWSAPVYDLSDWRFEGILRANTGRYFACDFDYDLQTDQAVLYAFPFVGNPETTGTHLWVNGRSVPDTYFDIPFVPGDGVVGLDGRNLFDPAIYIAKDGTILATYDDSTGGTKHAQLAKVNADDRTQVEWTADVRMADGEPNSDGFNPKHYEGSTIDLVEVGGHSYWVIQYSYKSNWTSDDYEKDVDGEQRWWPLVYVYSDPDLTIDELKDFTDWRWGGVIGDNGGFYRQDLETGEVVEHDDPVFRWGNNHGGLAYINGEWYVSNHRHTSTGAGRQGYLRTVSVDVEDGRLVISVPEYTSSIGNSIDAFHTWPAYIACHLLPSIFSEVGAQPLYIETPLRNAPSDYWETIYDNPAYAEHLSPIVGIEDGAEIGFKYLNFGDDASQLKLNLLVSREDGYVDGRVNIFVDAPSTGQGGTLIGSLDLTAEAVEAATKTETDVNSAVWSWLDGRMDKGVSGLHGVYFVFESEEDGLICKLDQFGFEQDSDIVLTTTAHNVTAGDFIPVTAAFSEQQPSNTVILNFTFDAAKFRYNGYSVDKVDNVGLVDYQSGEGWAKITLMIQDYEALDLGYLGLVAKEDAVLARERQYVNVTAEYVLRDEDGGKSVAEAKTKVSFTTGGSNPDLLGDTNGDGVVDILDLSNMVDWFGYTRENQGDWDSWYSFFDFNNNGHIDISDVAYVARLIR